MVGGKTFSLTVRTRGLHSERWKTSFLGWENIFLLISSAPAPPFNWTVNVTLYWLQPILMRSSFVMYLEFVSERKQNKNNNISDIHSPIPFSFCGLLCAVFIIVIVKLLKDNWENFSKEEKETQRKQKNMFYSNFLSETEYL